MDEQRQGEPYIEVTPSRRQAEVVQLDQPILGRYAVEFVGHALEQMRDRKLSKEEVLTALRRPNKTDLDTQEDRCRVRWNKTRGLAIDVVYEVMKDRLRVITAFPRKRPLREK